MDFLADTSYKQSQAEVIGRLTAAPVATGSQLVGYSGFSNEAFIREPASTDLDFGTGEWSASAWVNVPVSLPVDTSRVVGSEYITSIASGSAVNVLGGSTAASQVISGLVIGKSYRVSVTITNFVGVGVRAQGRVYVQSNTDAIYFNADGTYTLAFRAASTTLILYVQAWQPTSASYDWSGLSFMELAPYLLEDRSHSSGQSNSLALNQHGTFTATAFDGITTRTVTTTAAYNTGTWFKVDTYYKTDGSLSIAVNGQQVATSGSQTPLLTLNNLNAVLTIGNNYGTNGQPNAPFPGSIALLKLSATVPTTEQLQWMYEQEKALFNPNTLCALPDSSSILDLAYEDDTNRLIAISQSNESYWTGLTRVVTEPVTTGGLLSKVAAASNVHLIARSTVDAGVDVTIPASNIKTMLERDRASETIQQITIFDYDPAVFSSASLSSTTPSVMTCAAANVANTPYVGMTITGTGITAGTTIVGIVTGTPNNTYYLSSPFTGTTGTYTVSQTSFQLPIGYTTTAVYKNGTELRESISATKDWTRSFDGFKEVIILTTAPASNEWIQIHATKDN